MATTIKLKNGSGAPLAGDLVQGEPAFDLTNKRLYTEDSGGTVIEVGTNPTSLTTGTFTSTGIDDNATSTAITIDASENTFFSSANTHAASVNVASFANTTTGEPVAIAFGAVADNGGGGNEGGIYFDAGATGSAADNQLQFNADHQSSITPDMVITGSGNVGIGTTSPSVTLEVNGEAKFGSGNAFVTSTNVFKSAAGAGVDGAYLRAAISGASTPTYANSDDTDTGMFFPASNTLGLSTGGTERMRIDSSGRVGIGTTNPSNTLTVNKDTGSTPTVYINNSGADATDGPALKVQASGRGAGIADVSVFSVHNISDEIFTVRNDGNVGIGTTSTSGIQGLLHIHSSSDDNGDGDGQVNFGDESTVIISTNATSTGSQGYYGSLFFGGQDVSSETQQVWKLAGISAYSSADLGTTGSADLLFYTTNSASTPSERMRIDSSGNVGIGTASPSSLLNVSSGTNTDGTDVTITIGGTSANTRQSLITKKIQSSDRALEFYAASGGSSEDIRFFRDNTNETMRIDDSGNLLVGTTTHRPATNNVNGVSIDATFGIEASITSGGPLTLNRKSTDGGLLSFKKDGSTVGSISTSGGDLTIYSTAAGHCGLRFLGDPAIAPVNNSGVLVDNSIDIGEGSNRFKDLYLSGGAYLGGTAAANKLDDYEEGTWTPAIAGWTGTFVGTYTKIGNTVFYSMETGTLTGSGSGTLEITGLPFNPAESQASGTVMASYVDFTAETRSINGYSIGGSKLRIYESRDNVGWLALTHAALNSGSSNIFISGTYTTAA